MRKILVYVDAENISKEKFEEFNSMLEQDRTEDTLVVGKFYGAPKQLGDIMQACLAAGFEFVDTGILTGNRKNVADMKIAVDAIVDVMQLYGKVSKVYIVSCDHDFIPLVYKLRGQQVRVVTPFLSVDAGVKTCGDLARFLEEIGFNPLVGDVLLQPPYKVIDEATEGEFSPDLLRAYFEKKLRRIVKESALVFGVSVQHLLSYPIEQFDVFTLFEALKPDSVERKKEYFNFFSMKMYGMCLNADMLDTFVEGGKI